MKHLGDISKINGAEIEPVDIITFGSPCQDLSVAGKRAGLKHTANGDEETTRSGLFMEAVRIIKEMREATDGQYPTFALWENVPGAFSSNKGEDFRVVLEELIKISEPGAVMPAVPKKGWAYADSYVGNGWSIAYRIFDTQYWPRTPQRRRRIYLVADFGGQRARKVLFEREGLRGYFTEGGASRQEIARDAEESTGATDQVLTYAIATQQAGAEILDTGVCPTVTAAAGMSGNNQPWVCIETVRRDIHTEPHADRRIVAYAMQAFGLYKESDVSSSLKKRDHKDATDLVVFDKEVYNSGASGTGGHYISEGGPAPTLRGTGHPPGVAENYIVRRLTPTECARLQGFPDKWGHPDEAGVFSKEEYQFWLKVRNKHAAINDKATKEYTKDQMLKWYNKLHSNSAEYKMWGNGIALPPTLYCMQGIADALIHGIKEDTKYGLDF